MPGFNKNNIHETRDTRDTKKDSSPSKIETGNSFNPIKDLNKSNKRKTDTVVSYDHAHGSLYRPQFPEQTNNFLHLYARIEEANDLLDKITQEMHASQKRAQDVKGPATLHQQKLAEHQQILSRFTEKIADKASYQDAIKQHSDKVAALHQQIQQEYKDKGILTREERLDHEESKMRSERKTLEKEREELEKQREVIEGNIPPQPQESKQLLHTYRMKSPEYRDNAKNIDVVQKELLDLMLRESDVRKEYEKLASEKTDIRKNYTRDIQVATSLPIHTAFIQYGECQKSAHYIQKYQNKIALSIPRIIRSLHPPDTAKFENVVQNVLEEIQHNQVTSPTIVRGTQILRDSHANVQRTQQKVRNDLGNIQKAIQQMSVTADELTESWRQQLTNTSIIYPANLTRSHQKTIEIDASLESSCNVYATRAILQDMGKDINKTFSEMHVAKKMELSQERTRSLKPQVLAGVNINTITQGFRRLGLQSEIRRFPLSSEQVARETGRGNYILAHLNITIHGAIEGHAVAIKGIESDPTTGQQSYIVADVMTRRSGSWQPAPIHYIDLLTESFHVVYKDSDE